MPDKDGKLTAEDRGKIIAWLSKHSTPKDKPLPCPICGSPNWMIAEYLVQPMTVGPGTAVQVGGLGYPQVMLISNPCGYTRFLNAVMIGLIAPAPSEQAEKG